MGCVIDLRPGDTVAPSNRDWTLSYVKGVPLETIFNELQERIARPESELLAPDQHEKATMNVVLPVSNIAAQLNASIDIALANQQAKTENVVVVFYADGATSLNNWHETLTFAGRRSLPLVLVHQKNLTVQFDSAGHENKVQEITPKAVDYGFPEITVDGNDAVAVYRVAQEAIERARCGGGPTLIDAQTYPAYGDFVTDAAENQTQAETEQLRLRDPILAMELYLTGKGLFSDEWKRSISETFQQQLDDAIEIAENEQCAASI